jgi:hypothetical protein
MERQTRAPEKMKPETFHPSRQTWLRSCWGLMVCAPSGSFFVLGMHLRKAPQLLSLLIKFYQSSRLRDRRIGTACFYQLLSKFYRSNLVFVASRNVVLREVVSDPGTKTACTHGCESSPAPHLFVSLSLSASSSITLSTSSHVHVRGV